MWILAKKNLKRGTWWIVSILITKALVGTTNTLFSEWKGAVASYEQHRVMLAKCISDSENAQIFSDSCTRARLEVTKYPFSVAIEKLIEKTPSCIEFDCVDLLALVFNSWIAIIFSAVFALSGSFFLFVKFWRWMETYMYAKELKKYAENRESAKHAYSLPISPNDVTLVDYSSNDNTPFIKEQPQVLPAVSEDREETDIFKAIGKEKHPYEGYGLLSRKKDQQYTYSVQ